MSEKLPAFPKNQILWEQLLIAGEHYIVTSDAFRKEYAMYQLVSGKWKKLGTAKTPPLLRQKFLK